MVCNHIRKTNRTPDGDLLRRAVEAVGENNSIRKVAKTFDIPYPTLCRYVGKNLLGQRK